MKLSEILKDWNVVEEITNKLLRETFVAGYFTSDNRAKEILPSIINTALTSCDREIDREALAKVIYGLKSVFKNPNHFSLKEQEKMAFDDAQTLISTMPTWLKRIEG